MRFFDKIKGKADSWLQDEKNIDDRKEQIFPDYIQVTDEMESLWTSDPGYEKAYSNTIYAKAKDNVAPSNVTKKEVEQALDILNSIKKLLIAEHSERIYSFITIIQGLQRSNIDLWPYFGKPVDLNQVLGPKGIKLKNRDINALLYIDELIERGENLKVELNNVNANKNRREANQIFRK